MVVARQKRSGGRLRSRTTPGATILPEEAFHRAFRRERLLADRCHRRFCVAVFRLPAHGFRPARDPGVAEVILRHARLTDDVGFLHGAALGVLLRETEFRGADTFCTRVADDLSRIGADAAWRVFRYPHGETSHSSAPGAGSARNYGVGNDTSQEHNDDAQRLLARPPPGWKRLLDLVGAATALVVCAPVIGIAAIAIKVASSGPVFFRQERVGFLGRRFICWKLRTMHVGAETASHQRHVQGLIRSNAAMKKLDGDRDARVFAVGRFLRVTAIDELPQLFSVLRGDMSLIGPRPCIPYEYEQYDAWHRQRCEAMPGLTGLWQVSGKNRLSFAQMVRLDIAYARRCNMALDLRILFKTLPAVWAQACEDAGGAS
jgi:lipopolysaccharide/colanic/teichoic acid biosynthesis glycosyltransferase